MSEFTDCTTFSMYDVSIDHPRTWGLYFNPKRPFNYNTGYFRIENPQNRKGADISISINWEKAESENAIFAENYCQNVEKQYKKQLKKENYTIEKAEVIPFLNGKAAYIVSEYQGSMGITPLKAHAPKMQVRSIQLAWYDEVTGRAIVSSVIGKADKVRESEKELGVLVFSARCTRDRRYTTRAIETDTISQTA